MTTSIPRIRSRLRPTKPSKHVRTCSKVPFSCPYGTEFVNGDLTQTLQPVKMLDSPTTDEYFLPIGAQRRVLGSRPSARARRLACYRDCGWHHHRQRHLPRTPGDDARRRLQQGGGS